MSKQQRRPSRYYIVREKSDPNSACLVEANTPSQALRFVAEHYSEATPASAHEAVELLRSGAELIKWAQKPEQVDVEETISESASENLNALDKLLDTANAIAQEPAARPAEPRKRVTPQGTMASEVFGKGFDK